MNMRVLFKTLAAALLLGGGAMGSDGMQFFLLKEQLKKAY
ncbi:hypothetical protein PS723_03685 [Pseudomonas fluorescens]|uniref:Uncharacterized protein n=1 Tax=Pseudomonas fluorescens TaxID=294 RepID=A0A5E7DE00_PSEFL|nr:hypothetical protein PS723_03685 [Pseudomonas fluorescens]